MAKPKPALQPSKPYERPARPGSQPPNPNYKEYPLEKIPAPKKGK